MPRKINFINRIDKTDPSKSLLTPSGRIQVTRLIQNTGNQKNQVTTNSITIMPSLTRNLYLAKSIGELNAMVSDKDGIIKNRSVDQLLKSFEMLFNEAQKNFSAGDEEKAYLLFMRVFNLYSLMKNQKRNNNRLFDDVKYKKMIADCIGYCEKLAKSLERRYDLLNESNIALEKENQAASIASTAAKQIKINSVKDDDSGKFVTKDGNNVKQVGGDSVINPSIEPSDMYDMVMDLKKNGTTTTSDGIILLLDARRSLDFKSSHINNLKIDKVKVLNIPEEILEKGMAVTKLLKSLPVDAQNVLNERKIARKVILFDWKSQSFSESEHLQALFDALWKWDNTKDRCSSPPILLRMGYYGWVNSYPMFTTNSKVTPPPLNNSRNENDDQIDRNSLNFYSQLKNKNELPEPPPSSKVKPLVNGTLHSDIGAVGDDDDNGDWGNGGSTQGSNDIVVRLTNVKLKDNHTKIPGTAHPVPPVDRQAKPKLVNNEVSSIHVDSNVKTTTEVTTEVTTAATTTTITASTRIPTPTSIAIMELELKAKRQMQAEEELNRMRLEQEKKEKEELVKDKEILLRENVNLKRSLKPNLSKSLDSSAILPSEEGKAVNFSLAFESDDENDDEMNEPTDAANSIVGDEHFVPLRKSKTEVKRSDERTVSESSGSSRPPLVAKTGRSLSRSYSSPNIADHCDEDEVSQASRNRSSANPPQFDRSLKPLSNATDFPRSLSSSARSRNFSPIYGIPGQVNTGLKNLGNTCFMNAVLQCLADTCDFRRYFLQEKHMVDINRNTRLGSKGELADELGALIREIRSNQFKSVAPSDFKDAVGTHMPFFVGCEQQDAHEFLCMLLEKLHADLNRAVNANINLNGVFSLPDDLPPHIAINKFWNHHVSRNRSIVSELFEGLLMSTLKCTVCNKQSHTFEVFTNLSLPIPTKLGHRFTILDCLDLFSDEEKLYGEAAWECPTCKTKRDAIKQIKICKLPKVLVIHLKRFSYEGKWRQKLQNMVDFPLVNLNLKNYRSCNSIDNAEATYDLYGVVNHYGTLEGGHYVAFCKNDEKNKWFKYDDHEVTELSAADVKSHAAYLLFYASRN